jgi:argininosuccinate lyase
MVRGAVPQTDVMLARAEGAFLEATEISNRLVLAGVPFRAAHHIVGRAITDALEQDPGARSDAVIAAVAAAVPHADLDGLDPDAIMRASKYGGGPGGVTARDDFARDIAALRFCSERSRQWTGQWRDAAHALDREVAALCAAAAALP